MSFASQSNRPEGCLSPKEFAKRARIALATVHRYLSRGQLTKIQKAGKNSRIWIPESELFSSSSLPPDGEWRDSQRSPIGTSARGKSLAGKRPAWMNDLRSPKNGGNHAQKKNHLEQFQCQFFRWPIYQRKNGVWYADGRSNGAGIQRTSLGTKDKQDALANLHRLDRVQAENLGLVPRSTSSTGPRHLSIKAGRKLFDDHTSRPRLVGGTKENTQKRYKSILDKFNSFLGTKRIVDWNQVTEKTLGDYAEHLTELEYAYKTVFGELNTIKTAFKWLCSEGHLSREPLKLKLRKADCQRAYCYTDAEVAAMIRHCGENGELT